MTPHDGVAGPLATFRRWAVERALPLWADRGFDRAAGLFEEQLGFDGTPVRAVPRRVMVQARQISVYALASQRGWFPGRDLALTAGAAMLDRFWARDGEPGWVFSIGRDGTVVDHKRDLYSHAFVLFALAWLVKLSPQDGRFTDAITRTTGVLESGFADPRNGGYWDALPRQDALRRQNPHMHLLEADLELFEATGDRAHLDRATALVDLARRVFADPARGTLRELFDDAWAVSPGPGLGTVEPGHQFEWAWLLRRYDEQVGGTSSETLVHSLVACALAHGTDRQTGRIVDETGEDGFVRKASSRSWPHAEALKSLAVETTQGTADYRPEAAALLERLQAVYCATTLPGGWIDHVSDEDQPISRVMPASTLYHLMFGLAEAERCLG